MVVVVVFFPSLVRMRYERAGSEAIEGTRLWIGLLSGDIMKCLDFSFFFVLW